MRVASLWGALLSLAATAAAYVDEDTSRELLYDSGLSKVGLWIDTYKQNAKWRVGGKMWPTDLPPGKLTDNPPSRNEYKAYCWPQAVSHFDTTAPQEKFCQRYWVHAESYKPGGPVFLFDGGEGPADGIHTPSSVTWKLAAQYGGIVITLEHRYYGWSIPTPDLSTDNLRFLNYKDALQDSVEFIKNWHTAIPKDVAEQIAKASANATGLANASSIVSSTFAAAATDATNPANGTSSPTTGTTGNDALDPNNSPWIYYGGSYPGGRAAHMRALHPDIVYGAVSSSGVTYATTNFWQYFSRGVMEHGDQNCVKTMQDAIAAIDSILDKGDTAAYQLKKLFGSEVLADDDFAAMLRQPAWAWQSRSYRDGPGKGSFDGRFCPVLQAAGTKDTTIVNGTIVVPASVLNYANYTKTQILPRCSSHDLRGCYGSDYTGDDKFIDVDQEWRLWTWQVCTEWGYNMPAPPAGQPSIISRRVTPEYDARICKKAYAPGKYFSVPDTANVDEINKLGGLSIAVDRLAIIGGDGDPWRAATLAADERDGNIPRVASDTRPFFVIKNGGHCFDLWPGKNMPQPMVDVDNYVHSFIGKWLADFKPKAV